MLSALAALAVKRGATNLIKEGTLIKEDSILKNFVPEKKDEEMKNMSQSEVENILRLAKENPGSKDSLLSLLGKGGDESVDGVLDRVRNLLGTRNSDDPREGLIQRGKVKSAKASPYSRPEDLPTRKTLAALHTAGVRYDDGEQGVFRAYGENGGYWVRTGIVKFYPLMTAQRTIANAGVDSFTADVLEDGEVIGIYIGIEGSATDVEQPVTRLGGLAITGMKIGLTDMFTTNSGHMPAVVFANDSALQSQLRGHVTTERSKNLVINVLNNGVSMNVLAGAVVELCKPYNPID